MTIERQIATLFRAGLGLAPIATCCRAGQGLAPARKGGRAR